MRKFYYFTLIALFSLFAANIVLAQDGVESSGSKLGIVSPKEGELITGDEILLNIKFGNESGNHAHIWLDEPNPTADNLKSQEAPGPFLFRDVKPGDHTIIVELADGDHKPVDPPQKITLKVKTRSAADVTQEEIAQALKNVRPSENINSTQPATSDCATKGGCVTPVKPMSFISSFGYLIAIAVIVVVIAGIITFFFLRSKKQE